MKASRFSLLLSVVTAFGISSYCFAADNMTTTLTNIEIQIDDPNKPGAEQVALLQPILNKDPKNGRASFLMARAMEKAGYTQLAEDYFKQALEYDRAATLMWQYRNRLLNQAFDAPKYLDDMEQSVPYAPQTALMQALTQLYSRDSISDAQEALKVAQKEGPNTFGLCTLQAWVKLKQNQPAQAVETIRPDMRTNPNDPLANAILGMALLRSGHTKEAQGPLDKGFDSLGDMKGLAGAVAQCYYLQGKLVEAVYPAARDLGTATTVPEMTRAKTFAKMLFKQTPEKTLDQQLKFTHALMLNSTFSSRMHMALGDVFDQLHDPPHAIEHYLLGLNGQASHAKTWYRLAQDVENYYGANTHALYFYDKAVQYAPQNMTFLGARNRLKQKMQSKGNQGDDLAAKLKTALYQHKYPPLHPWLAKMTFSADGQLIKKEKPSLKTAEAAKNSNGKGDMIDLTHNKSGASTN